jgi:aminoglycoside 6'-N-acetyltransferase I
LWPDIKPEENRAEGAAWLARGDATVIVADLGCGGGLCGFVEIGERSVADGCATSPVAYLEGWYVEPDRRRQGIGGALLRAAENWARERGYQEFASDAEIENSLSQGAHAKYGFHEVERAILYRKRL